MGADEPNKNDPGIVMDFDDQAKTISPDVEDYAIPRPHICGRKLGLDVLK